jgi:hypothetical protein
MDERRAQARNGVSSLRQKFAASALACSPVKVSLLATIAIADEPRAGVNRPKVEKALPT